MVNGTEVHSLLPWENATLYEAQVMTGEELFERFWEAPTLANLTSALILYFSKIRPSRLKVSWSASDQRSWLGRLLVLGRRGKYKSEADYIRELLEKVDEFVSSGAVEAAVFPSGFPSVFREKKEVLSAAVEGQEQKAPDVFLGYTARELCKEGAIEIAEDVTGAPIGLAEAAYSLAPAVYQAAHGRRLAPKPAFTAETKGCRVRTTMAMNKCSYCIVTKLRNYRKKICQPRCTETKFKQPCVEGASMCVPWDPSKPTIPKGEADHRVECQTMQFVVDQMIARLPPDSIPSETDFEEFNKLFNSEENLKAVPKDINVDWGTEGKDLLSKQKTLYDSPSTLGKPVAKPSMPDLEKRLEVQTSYYCKQLEGAKELTEKFCAAPSSFFCNAVGEVSGMLGNQINDLLCCPTCKGLNTKDCQQFLKDLKPALTKHMEANKAKRAVVFEVSCRGLGDCDYQGSKKAAKEAVEKAEREGAEKAAKEAAEMAAEKAAKEAMEQKEKVLVAKAMVEAEAKVAKKAGMAFAMSTVGEVLAPVFVATLATQCLLPSDTSPWARAAGEGAMVITYLAGRQAFKEGAKQLGKQLLKRVGGKAAGRLAGVGAAALAPEAAAVGIAVVVGIGVGFAADYAIEAAEEAWVTDEEREEYECDCDWTSKWKCPNEVADLPLDLQQSVQIAKPKGDDLCFSYCCGIVNDMMIAAKDIIRERDALAEIVRVAEKNAIEEFKREELISEALRRMHEQGHLREEPAARGSGSFRPGTAATFVLAISAVAAVFWMAARRPRGVAKSLV